MGWKLVSSQYLCYTCRRFELPVSWSGRLAEAVTGEQREEKRRIQAFINFKVKHPRLEEMDDTLVQAIYGHRTYTLLPIYGVGGVGKSTVLKHVAESCRATETDPATVPVVEVQASPEDIGASARLDFYRQILTQLRGHVAVNDRVRHLNLATHPGKKSTDPAEWLDMRDAVIYALPCYASKWCLSMRHSI